MRRMEVQMTSSSFLECYSKTAVTLIEINPLLSKLQQSPMTNSLNNYLANSWAKSDKRSWKVKTTALSYLT